MDTKAVLFLGFLLASALGAPERAADIEDSESGFFFQNTRIVGGEDAPDGSVPWMVALSTGSLVRGLLCGASLVSPRHFLTAAHCIEAVYSCGILTGCSLTSSLRAHVGSNRFNRGDTRYQLSGNVTHPNYLSRTIKNDIGILISDEAVITDVNVQIIPLSFEHVSGGVEVMATGWGRTRTGGSAATNLQRVILSVLSGEECIERVHQFALDNNYVSVPPIEPHIEICTFHSVGKGTCNGDSGSALVSTESWEQVGAVSWGFPCAIGAPDMFARVSGFKEFILEALNTL